MVPLGMLDVSGVVSWGGGGGPLDPQRTHRASRTVRALPLQSSTRQGWQR